MISNAFKGAYVNEVGQKTQGINTITSGIKDAAAMLVGQLGFVNEGLVASAGQHVLAGRVGGIGGNLMLASLNQKMETAKAAEKVSKAIEVDQSQQIEASKTVFETLMNKRGMIESSLGEIDPKSTLGQKIKKEVDKDDNDR